MIGLLLACVVIMLVSLSGKLLMWRSAGAFFQRNLRLMVSFAAGVFLVFAWQLSQEVFEHIGMVSGAVWIIGGAIAVTLICRLLPHAREHGKDHHDTRPHIDAHRMLISDSIHNVGDGILLAASFVIGLAFGFAAAVSVFLHEAAQESAEFFVLLGAGYSPRRALVLNLFTSATILVGAIGGYFVLGIFEALEGPLLAIAAGGVLSVVLYDLLPDTFQDARVRFMYKEHVLWFALGCIFMFGAVSFVPHEHPEHAEEAAYRQTSLLS